jgi:hypothetical protein
MIEQEVVSEIQCRRGAFGSWSGTTINFNAAEIGFKAHPHMLRHACGFALANKGTHGLHGPI